MTKKAMLATAAFLSLSTTPMLGQEVTISDSAVKTAILENLGKAAGATITADDLAKVKILQINSLSLSKIALPDGLVNLEELDISGNILSPSLFNPIRIPDDLASLKILNVGNNRLSNLNNFSHLTTVEVLKANGNGFGKITIPDTFTNLKELDLRFNELTTFVLQEGFVNLEVLNLANNELNGSIFAGPVTFPSDLGNLRVLDLTFNDLGSLNVPAGLRSLELLYLEGNELGSINFGGPLPQVKEIIAFNNKIRKLTLPEGMANLETLDLFGNQMTELTIQDGLTLEPFIDLAGNPIEKINVPEGTHQDLITYFIRFVDLEDIVFFPKALPNLVDTKILPTGEFEMVVSGPIGTYKVFESLDLITWEEVGEVVNELGEVPFTRPIAASPFGAYRIEAVPEVVVEE